MKMPAVEVKERLEHLHSIRFLELDIPPSQGGIFMTDPTGNRNH